MVCPAEPLPGGGSGAVYSEEEWRNKYESMKSRLPM
jgi:intraflagellar transport protein 81